MTYQVLARKWRPRSFHELAGQGHVLQTLSHALDNQRLHHAYLFTGTRGVGKTTIARILAKCLNCEQGVSATPCGTCDACREIDAGRYIDLIEVDAASRTRVEDTRELLDNVQYAPGKGRFKVYLIDEVHMLSTHSFNALLKTLEEPPAHVKFLLATTDPQKLPVTILSRCLQFHLKNLAPAIIVEYLRQVLTAEQIEHDDGALWQLAKAARGSMRDALTLLDQAISFGEGEVREAAITALLGVPDQQVVLRCLDALRDRDAAALLQESARVAEYNPDYQGLLEQMLQSFHRLAIAQQLPAAVDDGEGDRERMLALASALSAEDVQLYYQIALNSLQDMKLAPDRRMAFEMALLRMLAFTPEQFARSATPAALSGQSGQGSEATSNAAAGARAERPRQAQQAAPTAVAEPQPVKKKPTCDEAITVRNWATLVARCNPGGIVGNILDHCAFSSHEQDQLTLLLDPGQSALYRPEHEAELASCLSAAWGRALCLTIQVQHSDNESPAARRQRLQQEERAANLARFSADPAVQAMVAHFDGLIDENSVRASRPDN